MKITAHVLLKNESRFVWYSVMSVLPFVDRIRIWDMGSTDSTLKIIEKIQDTDAAKSKRIFQVVKYNEIKFNEKIIRQKMLEEEQTPETEFPLVRDMMLSKTTSDWVFMLDADEIWWDDSVKQIRKTIDEEGDEIESIVVPTFNMVGDMFHFQEKEAGRYHLAGKVGHYNLRAFNRKIPGLHAEGEHGIFGWTDSDGLRIEYRDPKKIKFLDAPYLHATHLQRSRTHIDDKKVYKRGRKFKYEIGIEVPLDFYYPEVFFRPRPEIVPAVWEAQNLKYKSRAFFETPARKIYRRTLLKNLKHGY